MLTLASSPPVSKYACVADEAYNKTRDTRGVVGAVSMDVGSMAAVIGAVSAPADLLKNPVGTKNPAGSAATNPVGASADALADEDGRALHPCRRVRMPSVQLIATILLCISSTSHAITDFFNILELQRLVPSSFKSMSVFMIIINNFEYSVNYE